MAHCFAEDLLPIWNWLHSVKKKKKILFVKCRPVWDESRRKFKTLFSARLDQEWRVVQWLLYLRFPKLKQLDSIAGSIGGTGLNRGQRVTTRKE